MKKKKKKKTKDSNSITVFGVNLSKDIFVSVVFFAIFFAITGVHTIYTKHKLDHGETEIVVAEIIDKGIRRRGGLGVKPQIGYIKFRYFIRGKEVIRSSESFQIRDNIEQYRVGDCIELLVSSEDVNIYKWNKSKGTFNCK